MKQPWARLIITIAVATVWLAGASRVQGAETKPGFSNATLNGIFVLRTSGHSLFTSPSELISTPVYLASTGLLTFDGQGLVSGNVATSATRTEVSPAGKAEGTGAYSSQVLCNLKMSGTYTINADGTGTITISFSPVGGAATCGASTGAFNVVVVSPDQAELVSSGQLMSDPSKGAFNAYVVEGELIRQRPGSRR